LNLGWCDKTQESVDILSATFAQTKEVIHEE